MRCTLLPLLAISCCACAGQPPRVTGAVSGEVRCQDGNTPARQATVRLIPLSSLIADPTAPAPPSLKQVDTQTDLQGIFSVNALAPGTYLVDAQLPGYTDTLDFIRSATTHLSPQQRRKLLDPLTAVTVTPGTEAHQNLVLSRGASIEGSVTVDTGGLVGPENVTATLISSPLFDALHLSDKYASTYIRQSLLDDLGHFRVAGLLPGVYLISIRLTEVYLTASVVDHKLVSLTPTRAGSGSLIVYAPAELSRSSAKLLSIRDGDRVTDADIVIPMSTLHSVHGTVLQGGNPAAGVAVMLRSSSQRPKDMGEDIPDAIPDGSGSFSFELLPPGSYTLSVRRLEHLRSSSSSDPNAIEPLTQLTIDLGNTDLSDVLLDLPSTRPEAP